MTELAIRPDSAALEPMTRERAEQLQRSMVSRIDDFEHDLTEFHAGQGWRALGYDMFREWWDEVVGQRRLGGPVKAIVLNQMHEEQQTLPPPQRESQRKLGERVGASETTAARQVGARSAGASFDAPADLEPDLEPVPEPEVCEPVVIDAVVIEAPPHIEHAFALRAELPRVEPETPEQAAARVDLETALRLYIEAFGWGG